MAKAFRKGVSDGIDNTFESHKHLRQRRFEQRSKNQELVDYARSLKASGVPASEILQEVKAFTKQANDANLGPTLRRKAFLAERTKEHEKYWENNSAKPDPSWIRIFGQACILSTIFFTVTGWVILIVLYTSNADAGLQHVITSTQIVE